LAGTLGDAGQQREACAVTTNAVPTLPFGGKVDPF
jgi:hypothetical protein